MRVLFLTLYPEAAASPRYRVGQFLPYLRSKGIKCDVRAPLSEGLWRGLSGRAGWGGWYHLAETPSRLLQLLNAGRYDVVVLQKAIMTAYWSGLHRLLRAQSRRLVYDIDDAVHLAPPHPLSPPWNQLEDREQVRKIFKEADLVLAGNRWLAGEVRAAGGRAMEFPTVVDTERFVPAAAPPKEYRLGWMGSASTTPALEIIGPALAMVENAQVRLVGADPNRVHLQRAEVRPWNLAQEVREIQEFSVGLFPQIRDPWTLGKCALKALTYMACEVPVLAEPYGAIQEIMQSGREGLFADTEPAWCEALEALRSEELRARLGAAGRATVESKYSLQVAAPRWHAVLEEMA